MSQIHVQWWHFSEVIGYCGFQEQNPLELQSTRWGWIGFCKQPLHMFYGCYSWPHQDAPNTEGLISRPFVGELILLSDSEPDGPREWYRLLVFSCPQQLNRWPCPLLGRSLCLTKLTIPTFFLQIFYNFFQTLSPTFFQKISTCCLLFFIFFILFSTFSQLFLFDEKYNQIQILLDFALRSSPPERVCTRVSVPPKHVLLK